MNVLRKICVTVGLVFTTAVLATTPAVAADASAASSATTATTQTAGAAQAPRVVVAPRPGRVVRSHVVRIRLRASGLAGAVRARLNGVQIGDEFGPQRKGLRTLRTSISHGLRRGRNVLRVTTRRRDGFTRRARVRFIVRTKGPLVGAGRNRRIVVRRTVHLHGRVAPATLGAARPRPRWKVVGAPRGGRVRAATGTRLKSRAGLIAAFRPTRRGTYTFRFTVGTGDKAKTDRVTLRAVPPQPLVAVDTQASNNRNHPAIKIGSTVYPAGPGDQNGLVQAIVLDRDTLAVGSNTTYTSNLSDLTADLAKLDPSNLVVVGSTEAGQRRHDLPDAIARIGSSDEDVRVRFSGPYDYAVIGVPGMKRGEADEANTWQNHGLKGYLTPDEFGSYGYVPAARRPFRYAPQQTAPCNPCQGANGFLVHDWDPLTLDPAFEGRDNRFYNTNGRDLTVNQRAAEANRMATDLLAIDPGDVVTIETVTDRQANEDETRAPVGPIDVATMGRLATAVASIGGTRNAFNQAAVRTGTPAAGGLMYTLVGWAGAEEGEGAEAAAGINGTPEVPTLSGVLRPDRQSRFRPSSVTTDGRDADVLTGMIMQAPSQNWPLSDDPGALRALAYLGSTDSRLGRDPRTAYWVQRWDEGTTQAIISGINGQSYPESPADVRAPGALRSPAALNFTLPEFDAAKRQLKTELAQVGRVRTYMNDLARPFGDSQLTDWAQAHDIADQVWRSARQPDDETAFRWIDFTKIILELLAPFTHDVTAELGALLDLGVWAHGATKAGASTYDEVAIQADDLGTELVARAQQTAEHYRRMADIIVSDPAKLAYFGTNGGCDLVTDPSCPEPLAWGTKQQIQASANIYRSVARLSYEKLLPLGYHVFRTVTEGWFGHGAWRLAPPDIHDYYCNNYEAWRDVPQAASTALVEQVDPAGAAAPNGMWVFRTLVLGVPPASSDQHAVPPPDDLLKRMFDSVPPSNDPTVGGLDISPQDLMSNAKQWYWEYNERYEYGRCGWVG